MIAHADVSRQAGGGANHPCHRELGRPRTQHQYAAPALHILAQTGRRPVGGDHQVELPYAQPIHVLADGEGHVFFGEQAEHPAIGLLVAGAIRQQQHPRGAGLAGIILFVGRGPGENGLGRLVSLPVL